MKIKKDSQIRKISKKRRKISKVPKRKSQPKKRISKSKSQPKKRISKIKSKVKPKTQKRVSNKQKLCKRKKISIVMGEFKRGNLKMRNKQVVTNPKQAIAIALSEANRYCT